MDFSSEVVSIEKNGGVGTIWLDRPDKYNALNEAFWLAIPMALSALAADEDIRVAMNNSYHRQWAFSKRGHRILKSRCTLKLPKISHRF